MTIDIATGKTLIYMEFSVEVVIRRSAVIGISIMVLLCLTPQVHAQEPYVYFQKIINYDEEGKPLLMPYFVYSDHRWNELYVIDGRGRIIVYNSEFYPILTLDRRWGIVSPLSLTMDRRGNLYVIQAPSRQYRDYRISVFNRALIWERDIVLKAEIKGKEFLPRRLAVDERGDIYVVGENFRGVVVLDSKGELKGILSPVEKGEKAPIVDVRIDDKGWIYLVNIWDSRIYVYNKNRSFLFAFGEKGGVMGKLSQPKTVAVDVRRGLIYVVDYMRHSVSAYSRNRGVFLFEFGGRGWSEGWFQFPVYIDVDSEGRIIVADFFNNRVQVFKPSTRAILGEYIVVQ